MFYTFTLNKKSALIVRFMRQYLEKVGKTNTSTCEYASISD